MTATLLSNLRVAGATENARVEMNDAARIRNGQNIRRPKKKSNIVTRQTYQIVCHDLTAVHTFGSSFYQQ